MIKVYCVIAAGVVSVLASGAFIHFRIVHARVRELTDRLAYSASHDHITGLLNRSSWYGAANAMILQAVADGTPVSLIYIDIDQFKRINDELGHAAGDRVLEQIGRCLTDTVHRETLAARIGGEEFLVMLPASSLAAALALANQLHERLNAMPALPFQVTASMGIAQYIDGESLEDLIERADQAMLHAKRDGRNASAVSPGNTVVDSTTPRYTSAPTSLATMPAVAYMTIRNGSGVSINGAPFHDR